MTEYEKLIVPCENAEMIIKNRVGGHTYNKIVSLLKSSSFDLGLGLNFTANLINKEFESGEEYGDFLNRLMKEFTRDNVILAYIARMVVPIQNLYL